MSNAELSSPAALRSIHSLTFKSSHFPYGTNAFIKGMLNVWGLCDLDDLNFELPIHHSSQDALRETWLSVGTYLREAIEAIEHERQEQSQE